MLENENLVDVEKVKDLQLNENFLETVPDFKKVSELAERLDFLDIVILRKFYLTSKNYVLNTKPYCFPVLFKEMKELHKMKIGLEALRKRLKVLIDVGLLIKVDRSNPSTYLPVKERETFIKAIVTKFFLINGLTKFI